MNGRFGTYLPGLIVLLAAGYLAMALRPSHPAAEDFQLQQFGKIPVLDGGRAQPIDSKARNTLMIISGKQSFTDENGKSQPAVKWLLEVMSCRVVLDQRLKEAGRLHITSAELRQLAELPERASGIYEASELTQNGFISLLKLAIVAEEKKPADQTEMEKQALAVAHDLRDFINLRKQRPDLTGPAARYKVFRIESDQVLNTLKLEQRPGLRYSLEEIQPKWQVIEDAARRANEMEAKHRQLFDVKILELAEHMQMYMELAQQRKPLAVPSTKAPGEWKSLADTRDEPDEPAAAGFERMLLAYAQKRPDDFNREVAAYGEYLDRDNATAVWKGKLEAFLNGVDPFGRCEYIYPIVFLLAFLGLAFQYAPLNRSAFWLGVLALTVHSIGLGARIIIMGRPPVTNLYSSSIFIGWGCVVLALVLEQIYRNGIGNIVGSVMGFATVIIADHLLSAGGDTMEMLQAVLDTNFWLATHVVCVTFGYTATFMAGGLGILYVLLGVATPRLDRKLAQSLAQMIYGVVCFATLLSFVGTVLGGIWADQSWGRFWGWDPKENGALLIVIWNALILHARWAGMVKQRGMAVLTIVGNMVTLWSWFGTNQLGVGLHAYGFNNTLANVLTFTWMAHIGLVLVGLLPTSIWWSFAKQSRDSSGPTSRQAA